MKRPWFFLFILVVLYLFPMHVVAESAHSETLEKVWVWQSGDMSSQKIITITKVEEQWHATVNHRTATIDVSDTVITVNSAGQSLRQTESEGHFKGKIDRSTSTIIGYWFQPSNIYGYSKMATPVTLKTSGTDHSSWQATINAQSRPFTLFLDIYKDPQGALVATLRNPERNEILTPRPFKMSRITEGEWVLIGNHQERERRLSIKKTRMNSLTLSGHPFFQHDLILKPADANIMQRYFSRPSGDKETAVYTVPEKIEGDWDVLSAHQVGFDEKRLTKLIRTLASDEARSSRPRMVHSLLVARGGKLVFEEYFYGHDRNTMHDSRSLTKVLAPTIIGAMIEKGHRINANHQPLPAILQKAGKKLDSAAKGKINLHHLMTHTSGLDCNDTANSKGAEDRMWGQADELSGEADFWTYTANLPVLHSPGVRYAYCSGSNNLVGASIKHFTGLPVYKVFDALIAEPMNFSSYHWNLMPNHEGYLGGGVYLRPRDILKLGQLFLDGGLWKGKRILDAKWAKKSITPHVPITPETTGLSDEEFLNTYFGGSSGYHWRIDQVITTEKKRYTSYEATGNGGQIVLVVPDLDLVAVFTGGNYRMGNIWGKWRNDLIGGHIIPALKQP